MRKLVGAVLFIAFFLLAPLVFAQHSDQSSSDGVLVSPPIGQGSDIDSSGDNGTGGVLTNAKSTGDSNVSGHHKHHPPASSSSDTTNSNSSDTASQNTSNVSPTDEIVVKSADAVMFQMKANLKLTQEQISFLEPIITDNIVQARKLQLSLENGTIDGKTMYQQKQQLTQQEYKELGSILSADQLKTWINIQEQE